MAHIEKKQLQSGPRYYVRFLDPAGRRKNLGGYRLKKDAESALKRVESELAEGSYGREEDPLFRDFYVRWMRSKGDSLKLSTRASYEQTFRTHILPYFGDKQIDTITPFAVQAWVTELTGKGMAAGTVGRCYRYLRACLKQAENWDLIKRSPCRSINLPRVNHEELSFLEPEEVNRLLDAADEPARDLFAVLAWSGLRLGEGLALAWKHLDFDNNAIVVERSWSTFGGFQEPKTEGSRRAVPMLAILREYFEELKRTRRQTDKDDLLFSRNGRKPLDPGNTRRDFESALKKASLQKVTIHSLRHTYASAALASGCSIKALQRALGHASATMTLNTYSHLIKEDFGQSLMRTSALFKGTGGKVVFLDDKRRNK